MFRIRLHGRGGHGVKTGGQVLGTAFFLEGWEVQDAPRYGAERRGAPIFSYVRASRTPIQERGVITRPDLVAVADETLVPMPAAGVLQGLSPRSVFLIASATPAHIWRERLRLEGPVFTLPVALDPAMNGLVCAAAAARLTGAVGRERLVEALRLELPSGAAAEAGAASGEGAGPAQAYLAPTGGAARSRGRFDGAAIALAAFDAMDAHAGTVREGDGVSARDYTAPDWIDLPRDDASVAAPDIHGGGTSLLAKTGLWRTMKPVIDHDHCRRCSWVCGTFCPDSAITVEADRTPRIDYDHCKGCMVCVSVCPTHAIRAVPEREETP